MKPRPLHVYALVLLTAAAGLVACHEPAGAPAGAAAGADARDGERKARVLALARGYEDQLPPVPQLTADALLPRVTSADATPVVLVDCRAPHERAVSTLPGAITPDQLDADPQRYAGAELVVYCTIGYRSSRLTGELRERGFAAANLRGGVLAWAHAGGKFVDARGGPTARVHVYGEPWDLLPAGYESER